MKLLTLVLLFQLSGSQLFAQEPPTESKETGWMSAPTMLGGFSQYLHTLIVGQVVPPLMYGVLSLVPRQLGGSKMATAAWSAGHGLNVLLGAATAAEISSELGILPEIDFSNVKKAASYTPQGILADFVGFPDPFFTQGMSQKEFEEFQRGKKLAGWAASITNAFLSLGSLYAELSTPKPKNTASQVVPAAAPAQVIPAWHAGPTTPITLGEALAQVKANFASNEVPLSTKDQALVVVQQSTGCPIADLCLGIKPISVDARGNVWLQNAPGKQWNALAVAAREAAEVWIVAAASPKEMQAFHDDTTKMEGNSGRRFVVLYNFGNKPTTPEEAADYLTSLGSSKRFTANNAEGFVVALEERTDNIYIPIHSVEDPKKLSLYITDLVSREIPILGSLGRRLATSLKECTGCSELGFTNNGDFKGPGLEENFADIPERTLITPRLGQTTLVSGITAQTVTFQMTGLTPAEQALLFSQISWGAGVQLKQVGRNLSQIVVLDLRGPNGQMVKFNTGLTTMSIGSADNDTGPLTVTFNSLSEYTYVTIQFSPGI